MASEANIESQVTVALDKRISTIETERKHLATKADMSGLETRMIKWLIATQLAVIGFLLSTQLALAALVVHLNQ
ncbi:MAG: hypothetical protein OXI30_05535 [Chloroflexota bacterium]|nr:hypothetical protein [Chloroflexota bacterium]MDE2635806.1 hypothetical protein [Chloroflexota bacterium]MYE25984.1 hypothetical protein [Chloroflexota bacterium]